jgi:hypothetical protein
MVNKTFRIGFVAIVLSSLSGLGGNVSAQTSNISSFPFLDLDTSARAAAMGGSFSSVYGDDVDVLFYNPALLNASMDGALSVSYLNHLSDIKAGFAVYARDVGTLGTVAAGLRYLSYGSFERADETGVRNGTFGAGDAALTVGLARAYSDRIRYGVNVHAIFSSIDSYRASAFAADAGLVLRLPERLWTFTASVHHAGWVTSSFGESDEALPFDVRIGVGKQLTHLPLLVTLTGYDLDNLGDTEGSAFQHVVLGAELQFSPSFNVRVGYNHRRHEQLKTGSRLDLAGVGIGFGLKISGFHFDYAFNSWSALGGLHQLTVRTVL